MYRSRLHCCHVHVHPANRDGVGVHPSEVRTLLSDIGAGVGLEGVQSSGRRSTQQCECLSLKLQQESLAVSSWPFEPQTGKELIRHTGSMGLFPGHLLD